MLFYTCVHSSMCVRLVCPAESHTSCCWRCITRVRPSWTKPSDESLWPRVSELWATDSRVSVWVTEQLRRCGCCMPPKARNPHFVVDAQHWLSLTLAQILGESYLCFIFTISVFETVSCYSSVYPQTHKPLASIPPMQK